MGYGLSLTSGYGWHRFQSQDASFLNPIQHPQAVGLSSALAAI
jgi:hypothetical protein